MILLNDFPIISLTSVTILDDDGSYYAIATDQFRLEARLGIVQFKPNADAEFRYFPEAFHNVTIVYVAGYATLPADIKQAVRVAVAAMYGDGQADPGMESESLGAYSYTRRGERQGLPPAALSLLAPYRKEAIVA
jgi:uncharacterized phiE125 gp8 family phage protein